MPKVDFAMTADGDLDLGNPVLNENGKILYTYTNGAVSAESVRGSEEGRMIRDLTYVFDRDSLKQTILNRLKTDAPDWFHYPMMGGNLTDLIGEPNTIETGDMGVQYISDVLTYAGLLGSADFTVRAIPVNEEDIMFVITILSNNEQPYRFPLILNLNHGLREV